MPDYKKIIRSSHFIFLVGDDKIPLTIHAAIVQDLSDPLYMLINNGHMKESTTGVATLEDVEPETFISFCEYAYTGAYVTPDVISDQYRDELHLGPTDDNNRPNGLSVEYSEQRPIEDVPEEVAEPEIFDPWEHSLMSVAKKDKKKKEPITGKMIASPYERLWEQFRSLRFNCKSASSSKNPDIIFHAKLYVFATKYLIEPLRQQCLKSLHRDLCKFSLNRENTSYIIDLLDFTYAHTGRGEPGGKSSLRDLLIHYTACEARALGDDDRFMELLDSNAEMGSDLVAKLVK